MTSAGSNGPVGAGSELPTGWAWAALDELGTWTGGGTPKKSVAEYWDGNLPWVSPKDMKNVRLTGTQDHITESALEESAAKAFPANSVAIVVRSGILEHTLPVAFIPFRAAANQDMKVLTPRPGLNPEWLLYALLGAAPDMREHCRKHGTTVASINFPRLRNYRIALPPRAEQDRIVERFKTLDARVGEGERSFHEGTRLMEQFELAILHAGFSGQLTGHHDNWERVRIGDVVDQCLGKMLDKAKNRGEPRPYLRNVNVQWGRFELGDVKQMRIEDSERTRYGVEPGDLLVCEGGEPGRCAVWMSDGEMYFQKALHRVRPGPKLDVDFLQRYLTYAARLRLLDSYFTGTTIKHLPGQKLRDVPVPVPSRSIQQAMISAIDAWLSVAHRLQAELGRFLTQLRALRSGLLHAAVSGRLVAQDPTDEPASEFLARLRDGRAEADREVQGAAA